MKTIEINVYKFAELSEEAQQNAIEKLFDINVDHNWWDDTYSDAENIGLKITGFDLDRNKHATGELLWSACEVAQNILNNHGEQCETYKTAANFLEAHNPIFSAYMDETSEQYESREAEDKLQDLESDFLNSLLSDYVQILQNESEYLTSKEAIIDTINANDYDFLQTGNMTLQIVGQDYPQSSSSNVGDPFTIPQESPKIDIRLQQRLMRIRITSNEAGGFYYMGRPLLKIRRGIGRQFVR